MTGQISANELKVRGITAIEDMIAENGGVIITVHGRQKYVILPIEEYGQLRELELDAAIRESMADIEAGRFHDGGVDEHLVRIKHV